MDLSPTTAYRFPGPAGELQRSARSAALIVELGDNYERYHAELAREVRAFGRRPDPDDYPDDFAGYCEANRRLHDLLSAEALLRFARGRRIGQAMPDGSAAIPLVDANERLVDATGAPVRTVRGRMNAAVPPFGPEPPRPMDASVSATRRP
jgi:hypothetical protein